MLDSAAQATSLTIILRKQYRKCEVQEDKRHPNPGVETTPRKTVTHGVFVQAILISSPAQA